MSEALLIPIAVLYLLVVGLLFAYGVNFFYLTYLTLRHKDNKAAPPAPQSWPRVTVQLPVYNERYVAERLISSAANLEYPHSLLEIQVLDDSTDETAAIIAAAVERYRTLGIAIQHIRRPTRTGYKAGALACGLDRASGEFIAIFDADFVPRPDYLRRVIPYFANPGIAFVQTRWEHLNREFSLLTTLQSLAIDAHFMVEQFARSQAGYWFNFNGTAGIWRKAAIVDSGGWKADTLTEDLDLSYRAFLRGWEAAYSREIEVPAELPVSFSAYRRQQHRWARGSFECAVQLMPQVWNAAIPTGKKIEATLHLTGYGVHLLLFALGILYPVILLLSNSYAHLISLFGIAAIFNLTAFAPTVFFIAAQKQIGRRWWRLTPAILFLGAMGAGMMLNTLRAAIQILRLKEPPFERTPKFGVDHRKQPWKNRRYQLGLDSLVLFELAFAALNIGTAVYAVHLGNWVIAIYASLFSTGLLFVSAGTVLQTILTGSRRLSG